MKEHDVEVEVSFLPAAQSGRKGPALSGYRPQFFYDGKNWDGVYTFVDATEVWPGETARAYLSFLSPHEHVGKIYVGMPFFVYEGARLVANGTIMRIIDLESNAVELAEWRRRNAEV